MRMVMALAVMLVTSTALAAPPTLVADVDYDFIDQNGFGWATVAGHVTVTLSFSGKNPSLKIRGKRRWVDSHVSGTAAPSRTARKWEGDVDETFPLRDVKHARNTLTFGLDPLREKLTATCTPIKVAGIARANLYECSFTGFGWHTIASLPELHHPIVLDANAGAKRRILNSMTGRARPQFGRRAVTAPSPVRKP